MEKNPTSSFKIGGILEKKIKNPYGKQALFSAKKNFSDFAENLQKCSLGKKNVEYFGKKNLEKF